MCFNVEFTKFLRTSILKNICEGLLLNSTTGVLGIIFQLHRKTLATKAKAAYFFVVREVGQLFRLGWSAK